MLGVDEPQAPMSWMQRLRRVFAIAIVGSAFFFPLLIGIPTIILLVMLYDCWRIFSCRKD